MRDFRWLAVCGIALAGMASAHAEKSKDETHWERTSQRTLDLADAFSKNQNQRNCSELLAGIVRDLSPASKKVTATKVGIKTTQIPLDDAMSKAGGYAFWFGLLGIPLLETLAPGSWDANLAQAGHYLINAGATTWITAQFWDSFLPNPNLTLPTGWKNKKSRSKKSALSQREKVRELFFDRLKQNGLEPPAQMDQDAWLLALSNGMPQRAFIDPQAFDREIDILKKRLHALQPHLISSRVLLDESNRISLELAKAPELQFGLSARVRQKAWIAKAVTTFAPLLARTNALQETVHLRGVVDNLRGVVHFDDRDSALFFQVASPILFDSTHLEEALRQAQADGAHGLTIGMRDFRTVSKDIVSVELELTLEQKSGVSTQKTRLEFRTEETTLQNALTRDPGWAFAVAPELTRLVQDLELAALPQTEAFSPVSPVSTDLPGSVKPKRVR